MSRARASLVLAAVFAFSLGVFAQGSASRPGVEPPKSVDLRKQFEAWGLKPRAQGPRGTCSVFTTVAAIEFGVQKVCQNEPAAQFSVEFANWASNQAAGDKHDGSFFDDCLNGFRKYGICQELMMPYQPRFDPETRPSAAALKEAALLIPGASDSFEVHWILPPRNDDPGLTPRQLAEVKATLALGHPVAFGSGHSVLLVGYEDDAKKPGGGEFIIKDSAAAAFRKYTYEFVRTKPYDVFWVEFFEEPRPKPKRTSWEYAGGTFKQAASGKWNEIGKTDGRFSFQETARTDDFVEIFDGTRQMTLRIYGDTRTRLFYNQPGMRQWSLMYDGRWVED